MFVLCYRYVHLHSYSKLLTIWGKGAEVSHIVQHSIHINCFGTHKSGYCPPFVQWNPFLYIPCSDLGPTKGILLTPFTPASYWCKALTRAIRLQVAILWCNVPVNHFLLYESVRLFTITISRWYICPSGMQVGIPTLGKHEGPLSKKDIGSVAQSCHQIEKHLLGSGNEHPL